MQLRFRISYIICFAFALFVLAGFVGEQRNLSPNVTQVAAQYEGIEKIQTHEKSTERIEADHTPAYENIHLHPQVRVHTAARVKDAAKTFLLSRYLSYLDDSFSLNATTTLTHAVAFHITAYRFLLVFPKHWFW